MQINIAHQGLLQLSFRRMRLYFLSGFPISNSTLSVTMVRTRLSLKPRGQLLLQSLNTSAFNNAFAFFKRVNLQRQRLLSLACR